MIEYIFWCTIQLDCVQLKCLACTHASSGALDKEYIAEDTDYLRPTNIMMGMYIYIQVYILTPVQVQCKRGGMWYCHTTDISVQHNSKSNLCETARTYHHRLLSDVFRKEESYLQSTASSVLLHQLPVCLSPQLEQYEYQFLLDF